MRLPCARNTHTHGGIASPTDRIFRDRSFSRYQTNPKKINNLQFCVTSPLIFLLGDLFPSERSNEKNNKNKLHVNRDL
jgi:hypothetical protein